VSEEEMADLLQCCVLLCYQLYSSVTVNDLHAALTLLTGCCS